MIIKKSFLKSALPLVVSAGMAISSTSYAAEKFNLKAMDHPHVPNELLVIYKDSADMPGAVSSLLGSGAISASVVGKTQNRET